MALAVAIAGFAVCVGAMLCFVIFKIALWWLE